MHDSAARDFVLDIARLHKLVAERRHSITPPNEGDRWSLLIRGAGGQVEIGNGETETEMWQAAYKTAVGYIGLQWKDLVAVAAEGVDLSPGPEPEPPLTFKGVEVVPDEPEPEPEREVTSYERDASHAMHAKDLAWRVEQDPNLLWRLRVWTVEGPLEGRIVLAHQANRKTLWANAYETYVAAETDPAAAPTEL